MILMYQTYQKQPSNARDEESRHSIEWMPCLLVKCCDVSPLLVRNHRDGDLRWEAIPLNSGFIISLLLTILFRKDLKGFLQRGKIRACLSL